MRIFFLLSTFILISCFSNSILGNNFSKNNLPPKKYDKKECNNVPEKTDSLDSNIMDASFELTGTRRNGKIEFLWTHNSNGCPCKYILQRSDDNENFIDISVQKTEGSSIGDIFYDIDSEYRTVGETKYYRLKVTDNQGNEAYSVVIIS